MIRGGRESWQVMITRLTFPSGVDRGVLGCSTGGSSRQSHTDQEGSQLKLLNDGRPEEPPPEGLTTCGLENIYKRKKKKTKRHTRQTKI